MKALTLWQPWATLVAIGAKKIETRSWTTSHRGPLAIHAAAFSPEHATQLCHEEPFFSCLKEGGLDVGLAITRLPAGVIVATCQLVEVVRITKSSASALEEPELSFGNYTPGRWAWVLGDVQALATPVPTRGYPGLWSWSE